ncbi:MAG: hypothetical protein Q6363_005120 [Candidatus Njordarchaeota archaeon]
MIPLAGVLFLGVAALLFFYTIKAESYDRLSAIAMTVLVLVVGIEFLFMPPELNIIVVIPFLYFFPIVMAVAIIINTGLKLIYKVIPALVVYIYILIVMGANAFQTIGFILLVSPPMLIVVYLLSTFEVLKKLQIPATFLIIAFERLTNVFGYGYMIYVLDMILTAGLIYYVARYEEQLKKSVQSLNLPKFKHEVCRKVFHSIVFLIFLPEWIIIQMVSTGTEAIQYFLDTLNMNVNVTNIDISPVKLAVLLLVPAALAVFIIIEVMRVRWGIVLYDQKLLRKKELKAMASSVHIATSVLFVAVLFDIPVLFASVAVAFIADAASALVGVKYGKHKIRENRSLEGCIAGFVAGTIAASFFVPSILIAIALGIVVEIADIAISDHISDNIVFPIVVAFAANILLSL